MLRVRAQDGGAGLERRLVEGALLRAVARCRSVYEAIGTERPERKKSTGNSKESSLQMNDEIVSAWIRSGMAPHLL